MLTTIAALYVIVPALLALATCALASLAPVSLHTAEEQIARDEIAVARRTARVLWARAAWEGRYGSAVRSSAFRHVAIATLTAVALRSGMSLDASDAVAMILTGGAS